MPAKCSLQPSVRAELVLVEPGAPSVAALALCACSEQNHVLLLAGDESLSEFEERAQRRAEAMRRASEHLCQVTYLVGTPADADWSLRQRLLSVLCKGLAADGGVAVFASSSVSGAVLGCLGELQLCLASGTRLRAIFSDEGNVAAPSLPPYAKEHQEPSGVRFTRPEAPRARAQAAGT